MKITTLIAAATIAGASTAAYAGNPTDAGTLDDTVIILPQDDDSGMGSLGGAVPVLAGLLILGVVAAGPGS